MKQATTRENEMQAVESTKVQVKSITIIPVEGSVDGNYEPVTVNDWFAADSILFKIAHNAPEGGAYLKTDFEIEFEDGETYKGRYDVMNLRREFPDLRAHVWDFVRFSAGIDCPEHMTEESWRGHLNAMEKYSPGITEAFANLYHNYEIGG